MELIIKEVEIIQEMENVSHMRYMYNEETNMYMQRVIKELSLDAIDKLLILIESQPINIRNELTEMNAMYLEYCANYDKLYKLNNIMNNKNVSKQVKIYLKGQREQEIKIKKRIVKTFLKKYEFMMSFGLSTGLMDVDLLESSRRTMKKRCNDAIETMDIDLILMMNNYPEMNDEKLNETITNIIKNHYDHKNMVEKLRDIRGLILEYRVLYSASENLTAKSIINATITPIYSVVENPTFMISKSPSPQLNESTSLLNTQNRSLFNNLKNEVLRKSNLRNSSYHEI